MEQQLNFKNDREVKVYNVWYNHFMNSCNYSNDQASSEAYSKILNLRKLSKKLY